MPTRRDDDVLRNQAQYGSDRAGLVCAYRFDPHERARTIDGDAAAEWLAQSGGEHEGFLWLHFSLANAASQHWLREHLALPDAFYELAKGSASTRVEAIDNALLPRR